MMQSELYTGNAVFLPPEHSVWDMRQATKVALCDDLPATAFMVTGMMVCRFAPRRGMQ